MDFSCLPLDDIVDDHAVAPQQIAFAWSDTEGYEGKVIESGKSLWSAGVPLLVELSRKLAVHSSFDASVDIAKSQFPRVIMTDDLLGSGGCAPQRPISELSHILPQLQHHTDGLLLPKTGLVAAMSKTL